MAWKRSIAPKTDALAMWAAKPGPRSLPILLFSSWKPARTFPSKPNLLTRKFMNPGKGLRPKAVLILIAAIALAAPASSQNLKVTLLGTGAPRPVMERFGPSILVEAGKEKLLFDCGRGATMRLYQLKAPFADLNAL